MSSLLQVTVTSLQYTDMRSSIDWIFSVITDVGLYAKSNK